MGLCRSTSLLVSTLVVVLAAACGDDGEQLAVTAVPGAGASARDGVGGGRASSVGGSGVSAAGPGADVGEQPAQVSHRAEFEALAERLALSQNPYLGTAQLPPLEARLATPDLQPPQRVDTLATLAWHELRLGRVEDAVAHSGEALALAKELGAHPSVLARFHRFHALTRLRQAEVANCITRHNRDCCLLPLAGGGVHDEQAPARAALSSLEAVLAADPSDIESRWLLNLVAMALGEYPDGVAKGRRLPAEAFASARDIGRFVDRAPDLGLDAFTHCGGVAIQDFDGDGQLDIVTSSFSPSTPLAAWAGRPGLAFEDVSAAWGLDDQLGGLNLIAADHDDDGDLDLLVLRGAWLFDDGQIRNSLLRNDGGRFVDVTAEAGLASPARPTQAACFADFDNDGDLDLYVGNESRLEASPPSSSYPSQLFVNDGAGHFVDGAPAAGVTNDRFAKGVAAGDYDDDGDTDLYVSNTSANRLYRNDGALQFSDVAEELGVAGPYGRSFAAWFFDHDNDGDLDLFVGDFSSTLADVAADVLGVPDAARRPRLYRNDGGAFTEITQAAGLLHCWLPMGANFGDVDHDGWLDIYLATGDPGYETLVPNVLLLNEGGQRFVDGTTAAGLGHLQKGHGVAFADLDHDGDQDLFNQLGGFYPGDAFANALFENPGQGHHFLYVQLAGTTSNSHGLGARLTVRFREGDSERQVHRAVGSVSSFGGSPFRQELGLGNASEILELRVVWPASGTTSVVTDVPLDALVRVTEGQPGLEVLELR